MLVIAGFFAFVAIVVGLIWSQHSNDGENCPTCEAWRKEWEEQDR
jgi:hypothetical protein